MTDLFGPLVGRRALFCGAARLGIGAAALAIPGVRRAHADADVLRIGVISPLSGIRAGFAAATQYTLDCVRTATAKGVRVGAKTYAVELVVKDCQSTPTRAIQVGNELILSDKPDMIVVCDAEAATAIGPIADARGVPTLSTIGPWQAWAFSRRYDPDKGFPYTFHFFFGADELGRIFPSMWDRLDTAKRVGVLFMDNDSGRVMSNGEKGLPPAFATAGYAIVADTGLFRLDTDDFSTQISAFKAAGADIVAGITFENHMATFWNQATQAGYRPKICSVASGVLFPSSANNLGARGDGMSTEVWWTPDMPFTSSLTGQTGRQVADAYTEATGRQWIQPMGYEHAAFEIALSALKASGDPKNRKAVREALAATTLDTLVGRVDFASSPLKSVAVTHTVGGQWQKTSGGPFPFELQIVDNSTNPAVHVTADFKPLAY